MGVLVVGAALTVVPMLAMQRTKSLLEDAMRFSRSSCSVSLFLDTKPFSLYGTVPA
jgi:hypothetical protein